MSRTSKDTTTAGTRTYRYQRKSETNTQGTELAWSNGGITASESSSATVNPNSSSTGSKTWYLSNSTSNNTPSETTVKEEAPMRRESAVDLSTLRSKCESLIPYAKTHKYKLPSKQHQIFMEIVGLGMRVAGTDQYNEFHDITNSVFGSYRSSVKGSVAHQFIGCTGGKGPCHEDCAGAFPDKGYTEKSFCETHVGVYHNGSFDIHYSPAKPCSVLLLHSTVPLSIERKVAKELKAANITTVNVSVNGEITTHSVDEILACKKDKKSDCDGDDYDGWWLIVIIVVIVILIVVLICGTSYSKYWSDKEPSHTKW